jgi:hypothetical protein
MNEDDDRESYMSNGEIQAQTGMSEESIAVWKNTY